MAQPKTQGLITQRIAWLSSQQEAPSPGQAELVICDQTIDLTYMRLRREFVYLAVLMDVITCGIRGWHLTRRLDQGLTLMALRRAQRARAPEIRHSVSTSD